MTHDLNLGAGVHMYVNKVNISPNVSILANLIMYLFYAKSLKRTCVQFIKKNCSLAETLGLKPLLKSTRNTSQNSAVGWGGGGVGECCTS